MNCVIANNLCTNTGGGAASGGGLYLSTAGTVLQNCTIISNTSSYQYGGVDILAAATMRNCLVASNSPSTGSISTALISP